jgi:uncharacterized membrane protein
VTGSTGFARLDLSPDVAAFLQVGTHSSGKPAHTPPAAHSTALLEGGPRAALPAAHECRTGPRSTCAHQSGLRRRADTWVRRRADIQRCTTHSHAGTLTRGPAAGAIQGTRHLVALGAPGATCIQRTRRHLRLMHSFSKTGRPAGASEATS